MRRRAFEMHETAVVKGIVEAAIEAARKNGAARVAAIDVAIGDDSHVTEDALVMNFELLSTGTIVEGATVRTRRAESVFTCSDCGYAGWWQADRHCPRCGGERIEIAPVQGCVLKSIDVRETGDEPGDPAG